MNITEVNYREKTGIIQFFYKNKDGPWEGGGNWFDVFIVDEYYVAVGIDRKPFKVFKNWTEIIRFIKGTTNLEITNLDAKK